ncbi:MAG: TonB-dependent receptor plug domain-containing protein, partial [Cellvibrionaceae bacterium]|nr:TonB-dependent receptor plug domain-containing protein [Cellvibrionaceae bacterium]
MSLPRYLSRSGQLALAICAANAGIAAADTIIEETVVWGTKVKASSIKVDEETLALKQADHISDLLRTIPGVDVGGAHSLNQRITIRSMDDKDLRITIDGANQNTYMYHHMGNLQIHADILQAADIEIGSNSVVNSGLGGAVRFTTKTARQLLKPGTQFGGRLQLSSADNGGDAWALSAYGTLGDSVDALLYHNQVKRDNYEVGGGVIKNQSGAMIPGTDGTVRGLKGELDDTLIKLGWEFAPGHLLRLGYEHYIDEGNYSYRPDMGLATDLAIGASLDTPLLWPTEFSRDTITLNYEGQFGQTSLYAALFDNQSSLKRDETGFRHSTVVLRGRPIAANAANVRGDADNQGLNLLAETEWDSHTLSYGFEWVDYDTLYRADYL